MVRKYIIGLCLGFIAVLPFKGQIVLNTNEKGRTELSFEILDHVILDRIQSNPDESRKLFQVFCVIEIKL